MGPLQELNVDETIMLLRENDFVLIPKKSKIILRYVTGYIAAKKQKNS